MFTSCHELDPTWWNSLSVGPEMCRDLKQMSTVLYFLSPSLSLSFFHIKCTMDQSVGNFGLNVPPTLPLLFLSSMSRFALSHISFPCLCFSNVSLFLRFFFFFVLEKFIPWHLYLDIRVVPVRQKQHLAKVKDFGIQKCSELFLRSRSRSDQAPLLISSILCFSEIGPVTITTDPKKFQYELRELYVQVGSSSSSWREVSQPY